MGRISYHSYYQCEQENVTLRGYGDATILKRMFEIRQSLLVIVNVMDNTCRIKDFHIYGNLRTEMSVIAK